MLEGIKVINWIQVPEMDEDAYAEMIAYNCKDITEEDIEEQLLLNITSKSLTSHLLVTPY